MSRPRFRLVHWRTAAVLSLSAVTAAACHPRAEVADRPGESEAVQVGYATAPEQERSTPVSSLTESEIRRLNVSHVEQLFQGRVSGVQVTRLGSGEFSIRIRGTRSFSGGNEPLLVIDGIPSMTRDLARVTPSDVEQIDVLKGAAATIYGVRGANGVIVITTKRGGRSR